jgi:hypothetical protein
MSLPNQMIKQAKHRKGVQMIGQLQEVEQLSEDYSPGICLIRTIQKHYTFPGPGKMDITDRAAIPTTTQFVHIAITGVKMVFGSAHDPLNGTLEGFIFEVVVKTPREELKKGVVEFYIQAHMVHETADDPWFGNLAISIMCFG